MSTFTVGTADLRRAIDSVRRHADKTKTGGDGDATCHRVRLSFQPTRNELAVMATNLVTSAVAVVDLLSADGGQPDLFNHANDDGKVPPATIVDLAPKHCANILSLFPARGDDEALLRFEADEDGTDIAAAGGLFDGDEYRITSPAGGAQFPDVWAILTRAAQGATTTPSPKPLTATGKAIARFDIASKLYEVPLTVMPTGNAESRGFVVACGPKFLGLISSGHNDDDSLARRDRDWQAWLHRLDGRKLTAVGE